jgi:hydrogenase maturation protease
VLARLRERPPPGVVLAVSDGEPTGMIDLWDGAELAVVVDAVSTGADHGGHRYELCVDDLAALAPDAGAPERADAGPGWAPGPAAGTPNPGEAVSSHAVGMGETVALARALARMPRRLVVLAVDGTDFGYGTRLSPPVAATVEPVVRRVRELLADGERSGG